MSPAGPMSQVWPTHVGVRGAYPGVRWDVPGFWPLPLACTTEGKMPQYIAVRPHVTHIGLFAIREAPIPSLHHSFPKVHAFSGVPDLLKSALNRELNQINTCFTFQQVLYLASLWIGILLVHSTFFYQSARKEPYISSIWKAFSLLWQAVCLHYGKKSIEYDMHACAECFFNW